MARKLGELLLAKGLVTERQLQEGLRSQRAFGGPIGSNLVQLGFIDEDVLSAALSELHAVPAVAREQLMTIPTELRGVVSGEFARRHRLIPFRISGGDLHVAVDNPTDAQALAEASRITGLRILPHVAPAGLLREMLARHFGSTDAPVAEPDPPARRADGGLLLREIGRQLARADTRDAILELALTAIASLAPRVAVLVVREQDAVLWNARGLVGARRGRAVPLASGSVLRAACETPALWPIPVEPTRANEELYTALGFARPSEALVVPVKLKERVVFVLYAEDAVLDEPAGVELLSSLSTMLALSLERAILRQKILRMSGAATGVSP
ncbi:MAG: hypothetical protein JSV80_10470 [Acidobacteriota bacterium]|nr:MAG: hypothetical protein JSV80_10470 [Acidobacteriota bacterium]